MCNLIFLDTLQLSFIIVVSILAGIGIILAISIPLYRQIKLAKFKEFDYLAINDLVQSRDYYLLNNFKFKMDEEKVEKIDHIIGGNKYLYVVTDLSFDKKGKLYGDEKDQSLIWKSLDSGEKKYVGNPIFEQKRLLAKLSSVFGIEPRFLIGIVLINDECEVNYSSKSKQFYLIERRKLKRLIKAIESRKIGNIPESNLDQIFDILNENNIK